MKNKLILFLLLATSTFFADVINVTMTGTHIIHIYKNVPACQYTNDAVLEFALVCASWGAKYTVYTFEQLQYDNDKIEFVAYNNDCTFFLRLDKKEHECEIEFNADDASFDYSSFRNVMDFYFLYK